MTHARVQLDFQPRRPSFSEFLLLGVGVLTVLGAGVAWQQAVGKAQSVQARIMQLESGSRAVVGAVKGDPAQAARMAEVARALATPWARLLTDLESAATDTKDDVALLRIEPDRPSGTLRLVAETRSLDAALRYVQRLQKLPSIRRAVLQSHELQKDAPERPVRIEIAADWTQAT